MGRWSRRIAVPFLDFSGWREGEYVLDAGCGTGSLTFALAERATTATIEGIDFSAAYEQSVEQRMLAQVEIQKREENLRTTQVEAEIARTKAEGEAKS